MDASDFAPERNKTYVGEGLDELHRALIPFVEERMTAAYGKEWRAKAVEILKQPVGEDFDDDPKDVLLLILRDYGPFAKVLKSDGRTLISDLLNTRHHWAHHKFDIKRTFHVYECLCTVFERLKHDAPAIMARRAVLHSLVAQMAPHPPEAAVIGREDEEAPAEAQSVGRDRQSRGTSDGTSAAWAAPDTSMPELSSGDLGRGAPSLKRARLVAGIAAAIVLVAFGVVRLVKNSQPSSRPDVQAESGSLTQTSTSPTDGDVRQGPGVPSTSATPVAVENSSTGSALTPPPAANGRGAVETPGKREPPNLVTNGDFREHWDVGWNKEVGDPTQGSFVVEVQKGLLHMTLAGQNSAQVWQVVALPEDRGLDGLVFEAGVKLIPKRAGMLGLAPPVETALILQFRDREERDMGQIWYTQFATTGLEGSGLAGVPGTLQATGQRCQIPIGEEFNRLTESLATKAKDCLATLPSDVASVMIVCFMRTANPQSSAEAFLDQVRLYYR